MALIAHYIEHRRQREEQVIAALAEGLQTVEAIADRIYVNLAPALVPSRPIVNADAPYDCA